MSKKVKGVLSIAGQLAEKNKIKKAKYTISVDVAIGEKIDLICKSFGIKQEDYLSAIIENTGVINKEYKQCIGSVSTQDKGE